MKEEKMHIAMLIGSLTKGGSERVLVNLADHFVRNGHRITMVTQYQKENEYSLNPKVNRILADLTEEEVTKNRLVNFKKRFDKFRGIWKSEKPDIILSFIGKNNIMAILTSRCLQIPVAVSVRGEPTEEYYSSFLRFIARHLFAKADGIILQTKQCFAFFPAKVQKKAVLLRNPVNASFFRDRYTGERQKTIVAVGRIDENKNHEMIIRAFAQIAGEFPDYHLVIYGDGESRLKLIKLTEELNVEKNVSLPGSIDNVAEVIYKAGVFVLSSNTEGVPNTLIEAMLMGLAVIATDCPCGGCADLVQNGYNGILTPVGDIDRMRDNMRYLLENPGKINEFGKNAVKIADFFRPETVYGAWEEYLFSLCDGGSK